MKAKTIAYICNHKDGRVKFFMEEPASPMWESSELVLRHEAQAEIDALKAENAALHAECGRLTRYLGKVPAKEAEAAYDQVDRYLRNSLDDSEYADMSAALEHCYRTLLSPQKVLSAEEVTEAGFYLVRADNTNPWVPCVVARFNARSEGLRMLLAGKSEELPVIGELTPIKMPEGHR